MKKLLIVLLALGLTPQLFAQIEELSEVTVLATNYKYLNDVNTGEVASIPVKELERQVASFNIKEADFYHDDYDEYVVSFYIPQGKILAAYDRDGNILRAAERFENIKLPLVITEAVLGKYPGWTITQDVYLVTFYENRGANKKYKLKLENAGKTMRVKLDEMGNFQ
ncbi:nicotinate-nucleotide adenylyltransferase [Christiangramia salexigens]|uniref:Nicotinate-nucleotide adenylyltransferase n=1 Tax=Christiangramia salexigens TaxID=1913577 RepID=A0A1L3J417_9FLAO|nr:nicotinate-nucleotide adenylyltransferase [Christiangramia salexigens]APG59871.1 nicotinate-nucleotide adenylyltransferase [Christiangramia salexigens]